MRCAVAPGPASESGAYVTGTGGHEWGDRRRRGLMLAILSTKRGPMSARRPPSGRPKGKHGVSIPIPSPGQLLSLRVCLAERVLRAQETPQGDNLATPTSPATGWSSGAATCPIAT